MRRRNCWEIKRCGREPEGINANKLGVCPAALPNRYDGINQGKYGGRLCWAVTGTFNKDIQERGDKRLETCIDCDALREIRNEEGRGFTLLPLKNLR